MDNLTHSFVGLAASKAGLERLSPGTTAACLIATNAPDGDILSLLFGDRWTYLHHHRGITHSLVGTLVLALLIPLVFFVGDRIIAHLRQRSPSVKPGGLTLASLIVSASHPFMDWTNSYGIRPLLPWNPKWFYGDLVFIVDPFIWLMIGGAAFLLTSKTRKQIALWTVLGSILTFIVLFAADRPPLTSLGWTRAFWVAALIFLIFFRLKLVQRWGENIAQVSFALLLLYWGSLAIIHRYALADGRREAASIVGTHGENVVDVAAMPTL
ncbi:MAG: metal-dependent hydrolase, partial [Pyrinomonadaceae bacterium]